MMLHVDVRGVDPRDRTWELEQPQYRVYFHDDGGRSDEYELSGADIAEVMTWAESQRAGRSYVLYACVPQEGLGLVRLAGTDPNETKRGPTWNTRVVHEIEMFLVHRSEYATRGTES